MGREAIYWGVPIIPFAVVAIISLILVAIAVYSAGFWGVLALMPGAMLLVAMRFACSMDSKALERLRFMWQRHRLNRRHGRPLLLTPYNPKWRSFYDRRFAQKLHVLGHARRSDGVSR
ncbi:VirB3 family type IV secretion system protein [Aeromonas veronii]|uniref:VirB3 family type IV secretion system protein n=1 Tax=Aeromonas veronii TaxID=654 RepID=UPI003B58A5D3